MPTGYTAGVEDGTITDFPTFASNCAHAFGALVTLRDSSPQGKLPADFKVEPYHADKLKRAQEERGEVLRLSESECEQRALAANKQRIKEVREANERQRVIRERYATMRAEVMDWVPPTADHVGLKKFMLEQIDLCTRHDVTITYDGPQSGTEWRKERLKSLDWDIDYHTKEYAAEIERVKECNAWVKALRESLK